jgi:SAM-dependent methyltransferase
MNGSGITLVAPAERLTLDRGTAAPFPVVIHNESGSIVGPECSVVLRWQSVSGEVLDVPEARFDVATPIPPGESATVPAFVTAAPFLGNFHLKMVFQQNQALDLGEPQLIETCVSAPERENLDYNAMFAAADLTKDYWSLVGPTNKDDFYSFAEKKLEWMRQVGLTPDSRILDVGCGTGQVGTALEKYLSERGCYYGVDIAAEAIQFCKENLKRPNFHFKQSGMLSVPLSGLEFDCIIFFSVFTHTYVEESRALLTEAKRLLAQSGVVLGDILVSPFVDKAMGNRGAFEWQRDYFVQIAGEVGLNVDTVVDVQWGRYGRRQILKFTHTQR